MEISFFVRSILVYSLIFFFVGYILYISLVNDDDAPKKKSSKV